MVLTIDAEVIEPYEDESLRSLVTRLCKDSSCLAQRPLAAKIAGEVFNLNYIPVRKKDNAQERTAIRRAMAASNGIVKLLRFGDPSGRAVYNRTAQFVVFLAIHQLWPKARVKMNCTLGDAVYYQTDEPEFSAFVLKNKMQELVKQDIPLIRQQKKTAQVIGKFRQQGRMDAADLLAWRQAEHFFVYAYDDFYDYYYGELAPSTSYLDLWDILPAPNGFLFLMPNGAGERVSSYASMPNFFSVFNEGNRWCQLMNCENVADLNALTVSGKIRELIRVNEALHEKRYSQVADMVCRRGARAVMLAGPSSSGKTTSANRLATQLRVHGKKPVLLSLDDYYIDRDKIQPGPDGKVDLEHINTIDTSLFAAHLKALLEGKTVEIPSFDFKSGKRVFLGHKTKMEAETVFIIEGLHALNPVLLPEGLSADQVFRLYVSPLLPLNLDDHNRIPTSYLRLLRRIVRDYETRGASVEDTLSMWDSVQKGEKRWIFPYQENADVIFNSATLYELAVLKKHIFPLLTQVEPEKECYEQVRAIVKVLNYVQEADVDDEIPPTSLVREFIGGNSFYRKSL